MQENQNTSLTTTSNLQEFFFESQQIRVITKNKEPWFILSDVCKILEIGNSRDVSRRLEDDEKGVVIIDTLGGAQKITIINEAGLYQVVLLSRKPSAKQFKRWVTHEVLPQIRKHGAYMTSSKIEELLQDPEAWVQLLTALKEERLQKNKLLLQIESDKPKIVFADAVSTSQTRILIGELAKLLKGNGIEIGQNRLFERLRQDGFLIKRKGCDYNTPTQKSMELGLFKLKETAVTHSDGHITISKTAKITGKGQQYFLNYFLNNNEKSRIQEVHHAF